MLFDRSSAVRMRWRYLPQLAPWLVRFLLAGRQKRVEAIADALQPLVSRAYDAHRELIAQSGADDLVRPVGWLKVYETEAGFAATHYNRQLMSARGVRLDVLGPDEIRQLEPGLARHYVKGLYEPDSAFVALPIDWFSCTLHNSNGWVAGLHRSACAACSPSRAA